jgi:hypothetical protein
MMSAQTGDAPDLRRLIQLKNAARRPKDLESLAELNAILEDLNN